MMLFRFSHFIRGLTLLALLLLAAPAIALASTATSAPTLVLPWQQIWPIVIGGLVPLATYVMNKLAPWVSQPIKAVVLVVVSAAATALYTALATNVIGFNDATLQLLLTGLGSSLAAHHWLWKPSGVSTMLGAYADYGVSGRSGVHGAPANVTPSAAATRVTSPGTPAPPAV